MSSDVRDVDQAILIGHRERGASRPELASDLL